VEGPAIDEFEEAFSQRHDHQVAVTTSYGRMAFYYILKALNLPIGSEVIFPALTFWVVPEIARVLGLRPVFVDVDPKTFSMNPSAVDRAVTANTRAIVPTHLYGLPCDTDEILDIAGKHNLVVIEDCAHSLGALYRGRPVGTFGDAAFFSFQTLKPLNTYGGGMAVVRDASLASAVRKLARSEPLPTEAEVRKKLNIGRCFAGRFFRFSGRHRLCELDPTSTSGKPFGPSIRFRLTTIAVTAMSKLLSASRRCATSLAGPRRPAGMRNCSHKR
jgi:DegT/DnrJ/EryC1/StrS aminotransferase family protein